MAVYEPVSAERKAEMLLHLLMLSHSRHRKGLDSARAANGTLSPDLITKHTADQIVSLLCQIEVAVANGKTTAGACRDNGIT